MKEMQELECVRDRVGLGWRPEIGVDILQELESIDILEVVAENCIDLGKSELRAFRRVASDVGIVVHAVSLGLASTHSVSMRHLDRVAKVVDGIAPEAWSEHLAFVRTKEIELGHLAAPPWCEETVATTLKNIEIAKQTIGSLPHLENIATLYRPLGSTMSEAEWVSAIIDKSSVGFLLDIENVYANCKNLDVDWMEEMRLFPLNQVTYVHIAGGQERQDDHGSYFLDDHLHPVSDEVFALLEELAFSVPQPLTVILERDGNYPLFHEIRGELSRAREALRMGRERRLRERDAGKRC